MLPARRLSKVYNVCFCVCPQPLASVVIYASSFIITHVCLLLSITGASHDSLQLFECSNFFEHGTLTTEPVPTSGSAVADAIAGNQNFYFDEAVHKDKANASRDFVRLSTSHDCAAVVAVPLPCHSKVGGDPRAACPHCGKSFMLAGRPLGCLLLGIRRNTNYSIRYDSQARSTSPAIACVASTVVLARTTPPHTRREYLAKLVVLAGCLGPRVLAMQRAASPKSPSHTSSPTSKPSPQPNTPPATSPHVQAAMASSWYAPPATTPRRNSIDVGSLAGAVSWHPLTSPRTPTSLACSTLATLPEVPSLVPDVHVVQQRTSLDWLMPVPPGCPPDARMSLDSQVSAHSLAMLGSRGPSIDGRVFTQPMLGTADVMLPPSTAAIAQQLGLLDLVTASPEKLQLLEALNALQGNALGGYPPNTYGA